jgi:putative peptidoglycan lipid II flippase
MLVVGFVLSRVLGLLRESILASAFGADATFDAYTSALQPADTLFYVIAGGAIGSAFVPIFAGYLVRGERDAAWRVGSAVANLLTVALIGLALLFAALAQPIVRLTIGQGYTPEYQALTARLMQIMLISPVIFGISGLLMGILNAHQRFLLPAVAPSLYNLGIIFGAVALAPSMGIYGPAWGAVIGAALHLLVQVPGLLRLRPAYYPVFDLNHPGVREVARLMAPRVLGLAVVQLNFWVNLTLASGLGEGSNSALKRAWSLMLLPQGIIAQSVANAVFPTFSIQVAQNDIRSLRSTLGTVLRAVLFLSIPAAVGLVLMRVYVVRLVYDYGKFRPQDVQATAWALLFFGLGLVAHSLVEIVTRAFYALQDTRTPVAVGVAAMALNVILSLLLIRIIASPDVLEGGSFAGLALANTLATTIEGLALLWLIRFRTQGFETAATLRSVGRSVAASAGMGLLVFFLLPLIDRAGLPIGTLGTIAAGGLVYWLLALALGSDEAYLFTRLLMVRLRRRPAAGRT